MSFRGNRQYMLVLHERNQARYTARGLSLLEANLRADTIQAIS